MIHLFQPIILVGLCLLLRSFTHNVAPQQTKYQIIIISFYFLITFNVMHHFEIWHAPLQYCRGACQILKWYRHSILHGHWKHFYRTPLSFSDFLSLSPELLPWIYANQSGSKKWQRSRWFTQNTCSLTCTTLSGVPLRDIVYRGENHNMLVNLLAPGRCCRIFKSIIFQLITHNDSLGTCYEIAFWWMS